MHVKIICSYWTECTNIQIARKEDCPQEGHFIYKYKTFTLFARCTNMFYVQSALRTIRQLFYY